MAAEVGFFTNEISYELLRRLAGIRVSPQSRVVSLYMDLDPGENFSQPHGRQSEITSLIDLADRLAESDPDLDRQAKLSLKSEIAALREFLERGLLGDGLARGSRGLAVFACAGEGIHEVARLPVPVRPRVSIGRVARIQALAEIGVPLAGSAVLCSGDLTRVLVAKEGPLVEVDRQEDELPRRAGHGIWAPERTEAPVPEEELAHIRKAADLIGRRANDKSDQWIAVGTSEQIWGEIQRRLSKSAQDLVIGRFDIDVENASPAEVSVRVKPLLEAEQERKAGAVLEQLGNSGEYGIPPTLDALFERRVRTLVIQRGLERPGTVCPSCGRATMGMSFCPIDDSEMELAVNVIEWAVSKAIEQDADVLAIGDDRLAKYGGIAAVLRF